MGGRRLRQGVEGGSGEPHARAEAQALQGAVASCYLARKGRAGGQRRIRDRDDLHGRPITQATAHGNNVVIVYADRVELRSGWLGQHVEPVSIKDVSAVRVRGLINCTLTIVSNAGRVYEFERMALPDARGIRTAIERQKQKAGTYE